REFPLPVEQITEGRRPERRERQLPSGSVLLQVGFDRFAEPRPNRRRSSLPSHHGSAGGRLFRIGDDSLGIEPLATPHPAARFASSVGTVERKRPRLELLVADVAIGTGVASAEQSLLPLARTG